MERAPVSVPSRYADLPFVGDPRTSPTPDWTLPAVGGYAVGFDTGEEMAMAFLQFMRCGHHPADYTFHLSRIAISFFRRIDAEGGLDALDVHQWSLPMDSLRGQFFGFFNRVSSSLSEGDGPDGVVSDTIAHERDWLADVDLVGCCPSLERLHVVLSQAPSSYRLARPVARLFWFLFGMYQGRLLHEQLTTPEPEAFQQILQDL